MFASRVESTVEVGDIEVKIRKLSARQLRKAARVAEADGIEKARAAGADVIRAFRDIPDEEIQEMRRKRRVERYDAYDRETVLEAGVLSWTAEIPVKKGLEELDSEAEDTIFRAIIDLSVPTPQQAEAESGEDSGRSIAS